VGWCGAPRGEVTCGEAGSGSAHAERSGIVAATAAREASGGRSNNTRSGELENREGRRGGARQTGAGRQVRAGSS
jgi:hypothetical protein